MSNINNKFWRNERIKFNNNYSMNNDWEMVINKFENRIKNYYLLPISNILKSGKDKGEGFSVVLLLCALIEMLSAYKYGKIYRFKLPKNINYFYNSKNDCFIPFLQKESIFENHFYFYLNGAKILDKPFKAIDFYNNVRNGLIHEARTKGVWKINVKQELFNSNDVFIVKDSENNINLNRNILFNKLVDYFDSYIKLLKNNSPEGEKYRRFFARKLDDLFEIEQDKVNSFEWYNE